MTIKSKRRKLKKWLQANRLLFIKVGTTPGTDYVVPTSHEIIGGAMVEHPEYSRLIRDIVELLS